MNKRISIKIIALMMALICFLTSLGSVSFAAWWGTPGYEWALSNGFTGPKSATQLEYTVELDDLYATIVKYLQLKKVYPSTNAVHHFDSMYGMDNVARGIAEIINDYISRKSLTLQQYYIVANYVDKGYKTLETYRTLSQVLTRQDLKNIDTYYRLAKYKAATLIEDRLDREYVLSTLGYVKNAQIVNYNVMPYTSKITRREFLILMHDLLSGKTTANTANADTIIQNFYNTEVLKGYDTGLELDKLLNYIEMYTFLYRFEIYDFESDTFKNSFTDMDAYISGAIEGKITKQEFISYLEDIAAETNYQVDILRMIEDELGTAWTLREAATYVNNIYSTTGFTYVDNGNVKTFKK